MRRSRIVSTCRKSAAIAALARAARNCLRIVRCGAVPDQLSRRAGSATPWIWRSGGRVGAVRPGSVRDPVAGYRTRRGVGAGPLRRVRQSRWSRSQNQAQPARSAGRLRGGFGRVVRSSLLVSATARPAPQPAEFRQRSNQHTRIPGSGSRARRAGTTGAS